MRFLLRGLPGHPLHPPLTDATIGAYTFAAAMAVLSRLGVSEHNTATAWWLALIAGLVVSAPTAITGFVDWLQITVGTPLWRMATAAHGDDADSDDHLRDHGRRGTRRLRGPGRQRRIAGPDARRLRRADGRRLVRRRHRLRARDAGAQAQGRAGEYVRRRRYRSPRRRRRKLRPPRLLRARAASRLRPSAGRRWRRLRALRP